jgi:glycosyltransferase involved in cell wall biosynthesis
VVIGSSPHLFAASAGLGVARRTRSRFVFEVRDLWPESILAVGGRRGPFYYLLAAIAKRLYRHAERVIVLARGSADYLEQHGVPRERIAYVPNGVNEAMFLGGGHAAADVNGAPGAAAHPFTLIYAGAHGPANGLDVVLDAAECLRDDVGIRFLLVGDGPSKPALMQSAADRGLANVEFRPPVRKTEVAHLLGTADAGLMVLRPSPLFAFGVSPNKLFDYLAASLPVVCNVPGEVEGMLRDAGAGVQATDASAPALVSAIRELRARPASELRRMGAAGCEWVEREHSRARLAARLDGVLRELVPG